MKHSIMDRITGSGKLFTAGGAVLSTAIAGATKYGEASGWNFPSWYGYAVAAGVAVVGAAMKGKM